MSDILALAKELTNIGFPTLMVAILYGSFKGWWIWGKVYEAMRVDYMERLSKAEASRDKWQTMALRATGIAEDTVGIAKKSTGI